MLSMLAGLSCPGWVNFRCLMMRPFGCRTTPAWNGSCSFAVFGNQFGRFFGELHPPPAFGHGVAGRLRAFAGRGDGLYGFGLERFGVGAFVLEPEIYGAGVDEEDDALFISDDGDALSIVCAAVFGVFGVGSGIIVYNSVTE